MSIHNILTLILQVDNANHFSSIKAAKQAYFEGKGQSPIPNHRVAKKKDLLSFFFAWTRTLFAERMWLPLSLSPDTRGGGHTKQPWQMPHSLLEFPDGKYESQSLAVSSRNISPFHLGGACQFWSLDTLTCSQMEWLIASFDRVSSHSESWATDMATACGEYSAVMRLSMCHGYLCVPRVFTDGQGCQTKPPLQATDQTPCASHKTKNLECLTISHMDGEKISQVMSIVFVARPMKSFLMPSNFFVFLLTLGGESEGFNSMHGMIIQVPLWYTIHAMYHPTDATLPYRERRRTNKEERDPQTSVCSLHLIIPQHLQPRHLSAQSDAPWDVNIDRREEVNPGVSILIGVKRWRNKK